MSDKVEDCMLQLTEAVPELMDIIHVHEPVRKASCYFDIIVSYTRTVVNGKHCALRRNDTKQWVVSPVGVEEDDKDIPTDSMADAVRLMVTMNGLRGT